MNEELNQVLKQVQKRFEGDRFAYLSGCRIQSVEDGQACCTMEITENHLNAAGTVMGGAIFTLADFAFAVAANCNKTLTVSLNSQITYLGGAKAGVLYAKARKVKEGRTAVYYTVDITDENQKLIAALTANGFVKR